MMTNAIKTTTLHSLHLEHGARMVTFAGYDMPVQYNKGIKQEHLHTREQASLFDVSHMGQILIQGDDILSGLQELVPSDLDILPQNHSCYSVFTNTAGGVLDDLIITPEANGARLVVNAACKYQDFEYLQQHFQSKATVTMLEQHDLLALQGPAAAKILGSMLPSVDQLSFMQAGKYKLDDTDLFITRSGYTGEDGFEISLPNTYTVQFVQRLLEYEIVQFAGLGARDSLRLEAGLCLYGQDLTPDITLVEAKLGWVIGKKYHTADTIEATFPGANLLLQQLKEGVEKSRVGLLVSGKIPIRTGAILIDENSTMVGQVSSGGYGVSVAAPIAMGYVTRELNQIGTNLYTEVRNKRIELEVVQLPFIQHRYFKP